jgi:Na+/H+-dicarboxylate symporter
MNQATARILIGLGLGVLVGLFLGDYAAPFRYMADIYLRLLQMTVLPYVIVSVIAGFGRLDGSKAKTLFLRVGIITLVLWGITFCLMSLMPLAYPHMQSASFFATTLVEQKPDFDIISLYIPTNAFESLANNIVPAVVLFSAVLGIALIGLKEKEPLLSGLQVLEKLLLRASRFAVGLTPFGLFAIAANLVGTTDTAQLGQIRVFLIAYGAMALFLALWVLPGFIACLTPIPAGRVLSMTKDL